ncbi:MAG: hypothetical protein V1773_02575 [bacterium]
MKNLFLIVFILFSISGYAQFRDQSNKVDIRGSIINNNPSQSFLGFINPNNFSMKHSIGLSYATFGNNAISMGVYTNSMMYKFNDKLNIQVDASLVNSPYSSFGTEFSKQINGIYLSRAQINYQPSDDVRFTVRFSQSPYSSYYSPYGFNRFSSFYNDDDYFFDR